MAVVEAQRVTATIPTALRYDIERIAQENDRSLSCEIRRAMALYVAQAKRNGERVSNQGNANG